MLLKVFVRYDVMDLEIVLKVLESLILDPVTSVPVD
jgi:hypothetical protein